MGFLFTSFGQAVMVLVGYLHMILFAKLNHHQLALVGFIVQIRWCFESTQTSGENLKKIWGPWGQILVSIGLNDPFIIIHYLISSKRSLIFSYNFDMWKPRCSALLLLCNFIQLSLNLGSAGAQTLLTACWRFAMVRISGNGPGWK